jgi:UDP-glucose 4-epimerase
MSIIILGSNGFVASSLKNYLKKKKQFFYSLGKKDINFLKETSTKIFKNFLRNKKNYTIIITAAIAPAKNLQNYTDNIIMIKNIINSIDLKKLKKIIYISSDAVYTDTKKKITEKSVTNPTSIHGLMHLHRETLLKNFFDKKLLIIRPTLLYGKYDTHNGYGPNQFMRNLIKNKRIYLFGKGEERRDHLYVFDLVKIISLAIEKNISGVLNAVTSKVISFHKLANLAKQITNKGLKIKYLKRKGPMHHLGLRRFDNSKIYSNFKNFEFSDLNDNLKKFL